MGYEKPMTGAERVARRRAALRAQGLRPRTFWLPDPESEAFQEQAQRDVAAINSMRLREQDIAFIQAIQYWPEVEYDWGPDGPP
jgi:Protein  of unknown function (DUF3018)